MTDLTPENNSEKNSENASGDVSSQSARDKVEAYIPIDEHFEEVSENGEKVRHRGVYLLPNLFTTGALFSGFYAIVASMQHNFEAAAIAIFVAMFLDGMDGRIARLTNTSSDFGVQYDSLSDMVSFGLAPALVMFNWGLSDLGKLGYVASFTYAACAALRLARFNTQVMKVDKRFFVGLASPPAAALLASFVWVGHQAAPSPAVLYLASLITLLAGLLMVSNITYASFKGIDFKGRVPFVMMLAVVFVFVVVAIDPPRILLAMAAIYACSGPALWLWRLVKADKAV